MTKKSEKARKPTGGSRYVFFVTILGGMASIGSFVATMFFSGLFPEDTALAASIILLFVTIWLLVVMLFYREIRYGSQYRNLEEKHEANIVTFETKHELEVKRLREKILWVEKRYETLLNNTDIRLRKIVFAAVRSQANTQTHMKQALDAMCDIASGVYTKLIGEHVTVYIAVAGHSETDPVKNDDTLKFRILGRDKISKHRYEGEPNDYDTVSNYAFSKAVHDTENPAKRLYNCDNTKTQWLAHALDKERDEAKKFNTEDFQKYGVPEVNYAKLPPRVDNWNLPYFSLATITVRAEVKGAKSVIIGMVIVRSEVPNAFSDTGNGFRQSMEVFTNTVEPVLSKCHELEFANSRRQPTGRKNQETTEQQRGGDDVRTADSGGLEGYS